MKIRKNRRLPIILLQKVYDYLERDRGFSLHKDAPGHSHKVPGKWDCSGKLCSWCAVWNRVRKCVKR